MTLDELIERLEKEDPATVVPLGFNNPHSYRGDYYDLAFEPATNVTVGEVLASARSALGKTYNGWKGGRYKMDGFTRAWLAEEGTSPGETIGPTFLEYLLNAGKQLAALRAVVEAWDSPMIGELEIPDHVGPAIRDVRKVIAETEAMFADPLGDNKRTGQS